MSGPRAAVLGPIGRACGTCLVVLGLSCCDPKPESPRADADAGLETTPTRPAEPKVAAPPVDAPPVRKDGTVFAESELMGTAMSVNVWVGPDRDPGRAGAAIRDAFLEISRIEIFFMANPFMRIKSCSEG